MKKIIFLIITTIITIFCAFLLVGCDKKVSNIELVMDKVSYAETNIQIFNSEEFNVKLVRGKREKNFIADGKCVDVGPYATITVDPISVDLVNKSYSYTITGDKAEVSGVMIKNILGATFSANIDVSVDLGNVVSGKIQIGETSYEISFADVLENKVSSEKAIEYAYYALEEQLKDRFTKDGFDSEVYVRYINDRYDRTSPYYWYVSFLKDNSTYSSVLIDPSSGKALIK